MNAFKLTAKRAVGKALGGLSSSKNRDVIVLYHSVNGGPLSTPLDSFAGQLRWLHEHARVVPMQEMLEVHNPVGLRVAITFDDGYAPLYHHALPLMASFGMPATVFLTSGMLHERLEADAIPQEGHYPGEKFLSWRQARQLHDAGWSLACHGWRHLDSTKISAQAFQLNVERCRDAIGEHIGTRPDWLAYTWGHFSPAQTAQAFGMGMTHVFTCLHGPAHAQPTAKSAIVDRIDIRPDITLTDFAAMIRGDWDYLGWVQRARHHLRALHA